MLSQIEAEARRYAGMYPQSSDGRNTFVIFADWVAKLAAQTPAAPGECPTCKGACKLSFDGAVTVKYDESGKAHHRPTPSAAVSRSSAGTESDKYVHLDNVVYHLDDIEVDADGKCAWTDVANALTHIKLCRERIPAVPQEVPHPDETVNFNGRLVTWAEIDAAVRKRNAALSRPEQS